MKNSLEKLDYLIRIKLDTVNTIGIDGAGPLIYNWIEEATRESESIRIYLLKKSVDIQKEEALILLVQQSQATIIRLLDVVYSYKLQDPAVSLMGMYDALIKILDKLLAYIDDRFPKYFNQEEKVPDFMLFETQVQLKKELRYLEKTAFSGIDPRLKKIINSHLQKFILKNSEDFISYKKLAYIKDLVTELKSINLTSRITTQLVLDLLMYLNFNTADLFNYYIDNLNLSIAACKTPASKREALLVAFKKFNQLQVMPGVAFKPQMNPLREQVNGWIFEEIEYLEKQQAYINTSYVPLTSIEERGEDEKLNTSLSVQQLAVFIRAVRETGMVTNKNQSALLKTFAKVFRTPQVETISSESLRVKYYTVEPGAIQSVKDLLLEMFKKVQSY